jgi:hypothetical protein
MSMERKKRSRLFEEVIVKSWWTILFFLLCFFAYDQGSHYRDIEKERLVKKLVGIEREKKRALAHRQNLLLQIESQHDSSWNALILMKGLGLVPEGQQKVVFSRSEK